tara:strand:- start:874 stop:1956 length:1083 start_codon:yes stop_codon:yes gene_type:complete
MKFFNINKLSFNLTLKDSLDNYITYVPLFKDINNKKKEIDSVSHKWDSAKKISNDHEYIYTSSNYNKNISSIIPVSRSFFKLREILCDYKLDISGKIGCIAEAPGGFIQSVLNFSRENDISIDSIHSITLIGDNPDIPYWNSIILNNPKINICAGKDGTGNLYKLINVLDFICSCGKNSCSLVTADGGFDYTKDFEQELSSYKLFYSEIMIALNIQKKGGTFVCKMFDLFWYSTLQLVFILYQSYDNISFIKPYTSRQSNSEKYIVCKGFKGYNKVYSNLMCRNFGKDILPIELKKEFIDIIHVYHRQFIRHQIRCIDNTLNLINQRRTLDRPSKQQIRLAVDWCKKYKIPINKNCYYLR